MTLPDQSGLEVLMTLVPRASKPRLAVIVLTQLSHRGLWELAKEMGHASVLLSSTRRARSWIKLSSVQ
jgi:DNA-binding NarL/FixJ family response regulator